MSIYKVTPYKILIINYIIHIILKRMCDLGQPEEKVLHAPEALKKD
jgi:hypothetical protein